MTPEQLLFEADRCVKCALCLPYCPTYQVTADEAESPRGRISLVQGLLQGVLQTEDQSVRTSLDHCLTCRRCEGSCPSGVRYGAIIDAAREQFGASVPAGLASRLASPGHLIASVGRILGQSGLAGLLPRGVPRRLLELASQAQKRQVYSSVYSARREPIGSVALFTGCQGPTSEPGALSAAIELLTRCGYSVSVPARQVCCGAIHHHAGMASEAAAFITHNQGVFDAGAYDAIVTVSSGCGLQLKEAGQLSTPVIDVTELVFRYFSGRPRSREVVSKLRVGLYVPCTQQTLNGGRAVRELLQQHANVELVELRGLGCCGAAGMNLVLFPEQAEQICTPLMEEIRESLPDRIVTSNVGCAMHLREQLAKSGLNIPVQHPLELLVEDDR